MRHVLPAVAAVIALGCAPASRPPSFLVISLDTFRADRVGSLDRNGLSRTPSLDAFCADARVFHRAFAQANETLFSHGSLFMGRVPTNIAPLDYGAFRLPLDAPTLAARLAQAGYRTEAVTAGAHLAPHFGLSAGFQRYATTRDFGSFQETVPLALARLDVLAEEDRPFFLFVHGYDAHTPYVKPGPLFRSGAPGYEGLLLEDSRKAMVYDRIVGDLYFPDYDAPLQKEQDGTFFPAPSSFEELEAMALAWPDQAVPLGPGDIAFLLGAYDAAISFVDFHVGRLLDGLAERGLSEETVVVVLSDHGEDLLAHGFFSHRVSLHDENTRVVLALRGPGVEPGEFRAPVALLDVAPTLLALAGLSHDDLPGFDLREAPEPERAVYSASMRGHRTVRTAEGRLILDDGTPTPDVRPPEPPLETWVGDDDGNPIAWDHPVVDRLWAAMQRVRP